MNSVTGTIPPFLLPRLTWNGIIPKHQTAAAARGFLSTSSPGGHHCRFLSTICRKSPFAFGPFIHAPSSAAPSGPIIISDHHPDYSSFRRPYYWRRTYSASASSSSFLVMPLRLLLLPLPPPRSTLTFASTFNYNRTQSMRRRPFSTTPLLLRDHHFDTLKCVQRLKAEGFSEKQAKAMMLVLSDVIEESIQNLTRTMVLREGLNPPFPSSFLFLPIQSIVIK